MAEPLLLAQLSDPHVGAAWGGPDAAARLEAAVEAVRALPDSPAAVLVTGDIADTRSPDEYAVARELLERIGVPVYPLPGNHDDRAGIRGAFDLPGDADAPVQYDVDLGPLRLVALDSVVPGEDRGELDAARLAWLDDALAAEPARPTIVALHHPPLVLGIRVWDEIGLSPGDRAAFAAVLQRHPQVQVVVGGHLHLAIAAPFAGRMALSVPSTYMQAELDFGVDTIELVDGPPAFALHALSNGSLVSHLQPVERSGGGRT